MLGALAALLGLERDIEVVATAPDGATALSLVGDLAPDVLVTDIEMPGMTGIDSDRRAPRSSQNAGRRS